jgi:hypothetical protein
MVSCGQDPTCSEDCAMRYQPAIGVVAFLVLSLREEGYISLELFAECSDERACKTAVDGTFPCGKFPSPVLWA